LSREVISREEVITEEELKILGEFLIELKKALREVESRRKKKISNGMIRD